MTRRLIEPACVRGLQEEFTYQTLCSAVRRTQRELNLSEERTSLKDVGKRITQLTALRKEQVVCQGSTRVSAGASSDALPVDAELGAYAERLSTRTQ